MERELQRLNWIRVKKLVPEKINTIVLPIGTTEAHGAAALGTDNLIPEFIARDQAEKINALIAPTLNYGITRSLYRYPGSIAIQPKNFVPFLVDILNSLLNHNFKYIFVLNGHGGNNSALKEAAYSVHYARQAYIAIVHWWQLVDKITQEHFGEAGGHGGLDETACVQAIDPALVDADEHDLRMVYLIQAGADVYPSPGSVLLYKEGEGYPDFDGKRAETYLPKVCTAVGDFILSVIEKWKQIG